MQSDELNNLREAIRNSPKNIPLRKFLAGALLKAQCYEEAELECKEALKLAPDDKELKLSLAEAFSGQEKTSFANNASPF